MAETHTGALAFGPHVNRGGGGAPLVAGLHVAQAGGVRLGAWAAFVSGPRGGPVALRPGEAATIAAEIAAGRAPPLYAHAAYTTTLDVGAGTGARHASLGAQLAAVAECGGNGLVVHLPKDSPAGAAARVAAALRGAGVADGEGPRVYLETPAFVPQRDRDTQPREGAPAELPPWEAAAIGVATFADPAGLAELWAELAAAGAPMTRLGLCVDTAHVWTGGVCLRWRAPAAAYCAALSSGVVAAIAPGPTPRVLLHLNDSARARGAGPDRHAPLGRGLIWGSSAHDMPDGLAAVVGWAAANGFPAILERDNPDALAGDYAVLMSLQSR